MTRPSPVAPLLAALVILTVPLGAYVGGYFWLGEVDSFIPSTVPGRAAILRTYPRRWQ